MSPFEDVPAQEYTNLPDTPTRRVELWAEQNGSHVLSWLVGGDRSVVAAVHHPQMGVVVTKASSDPLVSTLTESRWLAASPTAPAVLGLDIELEVLSMEHIGDTDRLCDSPTPPDISRGVSWAMHVAEIEVPNAAGLETVRGPFGRAAAACASRGDIADLVEPLQGWWAALGRCEDQWGVVAFDLTPKNTLVDSDGCWWSCDPMCVQGPRELPLARWVTSTAWFDNSPPEHTRDVYEALLCDLPKWCDVGRLHTQLLGSALWDLWWAHPQHPSHGTALAAAHHWCSVFEEAN